MQGEAASTSCAGLVDLYATLAAHHNKKLLRGSWCCINDWRCYSVLHLPATNTDVDNRRVRFVSSFPHLALPVYTQDVEEGITLSWWLVLHRRRLFTLSEDNPSTIMIKLCLMSVISCEQEFAADLHELAVCHLYPYQISHRVHP